MLLVLLAHTQILTGRADEARESVKAAAEHAARFDSTPDYGIDTMRFIKADKKTIVFSSLGASAAESVENLLKHIGNEALTAMWKGATENE